MAQDSAVREQPSMDEILASIRRIIDAGEGRSGSRQAAPAADATVPPSAANDPRGKISAMPQPSQQAAPQSMSRQVPATEQIPEPAPVEEAGVQRGSTAVDPSILAAVDDYLEGERAKASAPEIPQLPSFEPEATALQDDFAPQGDMMFEPDISEVEAALEAEFGGIDRDILKAERQAKYDARFTAEDSGAFEQVASVLRGSVEGNKPVPQAMSDALSLVSETVSQSVSHSFADLEGLFAQHSARDLDTMAEDLMRPMLQEWLDNNLPSMVERLVRAEIERIARGEPPKGY